MYVLTLTQPWATLVFARSRYTEQPMKQIESRGWPATIQKGEWFGIHAARNIVPSLRRMVSDGTFMREPYGSALIEGGYSPCDPWNREYLANVRQYNLDKVRFGDRFLRTLELGAVLGAVKLGDVVSGSVIEYRHNLGNITQREFRLGSYSETEEKRFGWYLDDTRELPVPIFVRGYQKLWHAPDDVERHLQRMLPLDPNNCICSGPTVSPDCPVHNAKR